MRVMTDPQVVVERRVAAPPDQVWRILTDLEIAADTLSGVSKTEILTPGPFGVGTRWRETRTMFRRQTTEEMTVTAYDPPHRYVAEADSRGVHCTSELSVAPDFDDTAILRMAFAARSAGGPAGFFGKLFNRLGQKAVETAMKQDLADIAAAAERAER